MTAMATPEQAMRPPVVRVHGPSQRLAWVLWIVVSVVGAVLGALAAWQVRTLGSVHLDLAYAATVVSVVIWSGLQWFVLRRYRIDAYWWVPATVAADLMNAIVVIPTVLNLFAPASGGMISPNAAMLSGAAALAVAGLVVGTAQALVLRGSAGNIAWAWIPATITGGALAGALTTALSVQFFGLLPFATVSLVAATGALLSSAAQAPVFLRLLR
jgi:hypothetical protein